MHKRSQQKQVCKTKHPSGIYSPGFLSNTLSSSIRGEKNQFCHLSFFVLKKKNVCGIIHQHPATELSSASPGYVLDCYGSHANIIFLIFVPNTHICIIPMQPVYLQLLHQTYLEQQTTNIDALKYVAFIFLHSQLYFSLTVTSVIFSTVQSFYMCSKINPVNTDMLTAQQPEVVLVFLRHNLLRSKSFFFYSSSHMRLSPSYNEDNDDDNVTIIMASLTFFQP